MSKFWTDKSIGCFGFCGSRADIVNGVILPDGEVLTGRIGCFYEGCESGYISSNLGEVVAIFYDGGYCYAEIERNEK